MDKFLTVEQAYTYGYSLQTARNLTEEEKKHYKPEYADFVLVGLGESIQLEFVGWADMPRRPADGAFNGHGNCVWKITQEEWNALLRLNKTRKAAKEEERRSGHILSLKAAKATAEKQKIIPSAEQARLMVKKYNDLYNEGGEGYIPHIYTVEEYAKICNELQELECK